MHPLPAMTDGLRANQSQCDRAFFIIRAFNARRVKILGPTGASSIFARAHL
jgi:hypothetical protein